MKKTYQYIVENAASGKINREMAIELLRMLKQEAETFEPIAIIGIAARMPLADNPDKFWRLIINQTDCMQQIPEERRLDIERYLQYKKYPLNEVSYRKKAYLKEIDKFDHYFFRLSPKEASLMDPNQRLFLETAWSAIEDAGYGGKKLAGSKTGVYLGFSSKSSDYEQFITEIEPVLLESSFAGNLPSVIAGRISYLLDLHGPAILVDTACSSSLTAVHLACQGIRNRDCDLALAGGVKIELAAIAGNGEFKLGIESSDGRTRTFDDNSDGTGGGEGTAAFLLKSLDKALSDNDHIYAVIKGSAINQDGSSIGITAPNVIAQEKVIIQAWENAGIDPETITYLEAHGTGTKLGDPIEIEAISRAFRQYTQKRQFCAISALKSNIGHLDHAAGIAGLLKAVLALKYREIPPTMHFQTPNRKITFEDSPVYVNDRHLPWETGDFPRRSAVSAFGLSGTNCHVILEETPAISEKQTSKRPQILTLSARSEQALRQLLNAYREFLNPETELNLTGMCYTANTGRGHYNYRLAIMADSFSELKEKVMRLRETDLTMIEGCDILYGFHLVTGAIKNSDQAGYLSNDQKFRMDCTAAEKIKQLTPGLTDDTYREQLLELAKLYIQGADIQWEKVYEGQRIPKISLPVYPFERNRCWPDIPVSTEPEQFYFSAEWTPKALDLPLNNINTGITLVLNDQCPLGREIAMQMQTEGKEAVLAEYGPGFKKLDVDHYECDRGMESLERLWLEIKHRKITRIIYLAGKDQEITNLQELNESQQKGVHGLLNLIQVILHGNSKEAPEIVLIAESVYRVTGGETGLNPEWSTIFGLGKAVNLENPHLKLRCLDVDATTGINEIMAELRVSSNCYLVAYRNRQRFIETVGALSAATTANQEFRLDRNGVYIITGGAGGIGLEFGKYLALKNPLNIVLINRSLMPDRNTWDELLLTGIDLKLNRKIQAIQEIERRGGKVSCYQADVSKREEIEPVINEIRRKYGKIKGIIHAAGIGDAALITDTNGESFNRVLAAKVAGTWLLDFLTRLDELDFYILFSSAITITGGIGAGAYTAANSYLDAFAGYRNMKGKRTLAINWPTWKETGLAEGMAINEDKQIFKVITPGQALDAFKKVFAKDLTRVIIGALNYANPVLAFKDRLPFRFSKEIEAEIQTRQSKGNIISKPPEKSAPVMIKGQTTGGYTETQKQLAQIWGKVFGLNEVSIYTNFAELGGDSILALHLVREIETLHPGVIDVAHIFSYPTIAEMAAFLEQKLPGKNEPSGLKTIEIPSNKNVGNDVAIIGLACRLPGADNKEEFWQVLKEGISCIGSFPPSRRLDTDQFLSGPASVGEDLYRQGGFLKQIDQFDAAFFRIPPKEAELMDPVQRIFLETAWEAIEDAGLGGAGIYGSRTGVYIGKETSGGSDYAKLLPGNETLVLTGTNTSILAGRLAYLLDLKGPCPVIDTACSSSMTALHMAYRSIISGEVEMAITGGVSISLLPLAGSGMIESEVGMLRAFDQKADGTVWGEGFGIVVLKPLDQALRDKNQIYAVIKGSAINNDGTSNGLTAPNAEAQRKLLQEAWISAGINPETISYIEAHGSGTKLGDPIEIKGIDMAFSHFTDKKQFCGIGAVKTNLGHLVGAAGIASVLKMALALQYRQLPPTLNFNVPNPLINFLESPIYINNQLINWETAGFPRRCGVSSFGFSGTNCHLIMEEAPAVESAPVGERGEHIFTLSVKSEPLLAEIIRKYHEYLAEQPEVSMENLCYTVNTGRGHYNYRLAIIAADTTELTRKLQKTGGSDLTGGRPADDFFLGKHIVVFNKKEKEAGELSEEEKIQLSALAAEKVKELSGDCLNDHPVLEEICRLYVAGAEIPWSRIYPDGSGRILSLPTYPFKRERHWITVDPNFATGLKNGTGPEIDDLTKKREFYYKTVWRPEPAPLKKAPTQTGGVLIFKDNKGISDQIARHFADQGRTVILAEIGPEFHQIAAGRYQIDGFETDYERLLAEIKDIDLSLILHLQTISGPDDLSGMEQLKEQQKRGIYSLFYLIRVISKQKIKTDLQIVLIAEYVNEITGNEPRLNPVQAALFGLGNAAGLENFNLRLRALDICENTPVMQIIEEFNTETSSYPVAYRNSQRYIPVLEKAIIFNQNRAAIEIKSSGVYLITGGTGGIGLEIGKYLAAKAKVNLALINRTKFPKRLEWDAPATGGTSPGLSRKINKIREMENAGATVDCYSADVSEFEEMEALIAGLRKKYGRINGIIHCAGVAGDGFIIRKDEAVFTQVLAPKVTGTWIIDQLTRPDEPDFLVLCSSMASLLAGPGQGDYTAANSFLDSFAYYRNKTGKRTLTINWPAWKETGMAVDHGVNHDTIFKALSTQDAIRIFDELLNSNLPRIMVGELNYREEALFRDGQSPFKVSPEIKAGLENWEKRSVIHEIGFTSPVSDYHVLIQGKKDGELSELEEMLAKIWAKNLGLKEINLYDDFYGLGGDSILAIKIVNEIKAVSGNRIDINELFEHPTISELAALAGQSIAAEPKSENQVQTEYGATEKEFELSGLQKRLWFLQKYNPGMTAYNLYARSMINQPVDPEKLTQGLNYLLRRHEALRTVFRETGGIPKQVVLPELQLEVKLEDLSTREDRERLLEQLLQAEEQTAFDLTQPLIKVKLFKLTEDNYCVFHNIHHLILDGWSSEIIHRELMEILRAYEEGREPSLPPLKRSYTDWIKMRQAWLDTPEAQNAKEYWLAELSKPLPSLDLPLDYKRPEIQTFNGSHLSLTIEKDVLRKLKEFAGQSNATLNMVLLAVYFLILQKISRNRDIIVGMSLAGRDDRDFEKVVGLFLNNVCIRVKFDNISNFNDLTQYVREKSLSAFKYGKYPFDLLVNLINPERNTNQSPIFSTMFQLYETMPENENVSKFELALLCREINGEIKGKLEYNTDLFKKETIERFRDGLLEIIKTVAANPGQPFDEIALLREEEKQKMIAAFMEDLENED